MLKRVNRSTSLARRYLPQLLHEVANDRTQRQSRLLSFDDSKFTPVTVVDEFTIRDLAMHLLQWREKDFEGNEQLWNQTLSGDFVSRIGTNNSQLMQSLVTLIEQEVGRSITLEIRNVNRPQWVASGSIKLNLDADQDKIVIDSRPGNRPVTRIHEHGKLKSLLWRLDDQLDIRINDLTDSTPQPVEWLTRIYNKTLGTTLDVAAVLRTIEEQTGLSFQQRELPTDILFLDYE